MEVVSGHHNDQEGGCFAARFDSGPGIREDKIVLTRMMHACSGTWTYG